MDSTPAVPTAAAQHSSSSDSQPNAGGLYSLQQLQAMFKSIQEVYPKYGPRLADWWVQQGQAGRLEFLLVRVCCCWDTSGSSSNQASSTSTRTDVADVTICGQFHTA
jgi:hypothetical protein